MPSVDDHSTAGSNSSRAAAQSSRSKPTKSRRTTSMFSCDIHRQYGAGSALNTGGSRRPRGAAPAGWAAYRPLGRPRCSRSAPPRWARRRGTAEVPSRLRMPTRYHRFAGSSLDRLAALSDGVFAVAMTLLVLDLKPPSVPKRAQHPIWSGGGGSSEHLLGHGLLHQVAPRLLPYA